VNPIKEIISGELLQRGRVMKNLPFLLYLTFLMLLYIAYGYYVDNSVRRINNLDEKGEELYSELQSVLELYDQESLQSKIAEKTSKWGVYESKDPPKKIELSYE
jgi:hypothetical protein|tara:strand:- start:232 stop:543 length:312 start_codon:yes stop_codon:yes gene_type:complete